MNKEHLGYCQWDVAVVQAYATLRRAAGHCDCGLDLEVVAFLPDDSYSRQMMDAPFRDVMLDSLLEREAKEVLQSTPPARAQSMQCLPSFRLQLPVLS